MDREFCVVKAKFRFVLEHISGLTIHIEEINNFQYLSLIKGTIQESSPAGFIAFPR